MPDETVFYFAYGSNADPARFTERIGAWRSRQRATLEDHRLRFSSSVRSEGGGGAVIDAAEGDHVAGVAYEITAAQLAAMDRVEFDPTRDSVGVGRRKRVVVHGADGPFEAELYYVEDDGAAAAPSARYLGHILDGLAAAGWDDATLECVRAVAVAARQP